MTEPNPVRFAARQPTHPGAVLRGDLLPALRLNVSAVARHLQVSRQRLHRLLAEDAGVTPDMALRLGKLCGNGAGFWLAMQQAHDLWGAERGLAETIAAIPTLPPA